MSFSHSAQVGMTLYTIGMALSRCTKKRLVWPTGHPPPGRLGRQCDGGCHSSHGAQKKIGDRSPIGQTAESDTASETRRYAEHLAALREAEDVDHAGRVADGQVAPL